MKYPRLTRRGRRRLTTALLALSFSAVAGVGAQTLPAAAAATAPEEGSPPAVPGASSENKAAGLAVKSGQPVEILDRREEDAETFANPDGTTTRRQYSTPVWSRYEGVWKKADATVVRRPDGTVGPASATFGITFSSGGTTPLASMTKDDKQLSLSWPTALPQPVLEGNTALYKSVLPGVDLKVIADVDGFAEDLIINTPQAAADPAVRSIRLGVGTVSASLSPTTGAAT